MEKNLPQNQNDIVFQTKKSFFDYNPNFTRYAGYFHN